MPPRATTKKRKPPPGPDAELPKNLEAERAVLGGIIVHNPAYDVVAPVLQEQDFFREGHRLIWAAMTRLLAGRKMAVDLVTLKDALTAAGALDDAGGVAYVSSLIDGVPSGLNVGHYARLVKDKATLRTVITTANGMLAGAYDGQESVGAIVQAADEAIWQIQRDPYAAELRSTAEGAPVLYQAVEERVDRRGQLLGLETGFVDINELTLGWQRDEMIILAARTSIGKTALALNTMLAAAQAGASVAYFSLEMSRRQLEYRLLSILTGIWCTSILRGVLSPDEMQRLGTAMETLAELPIAIIDQPGQTAPQIRGACRRWRASKPLDFVLVDYVQLIPGTTPDNNRYAELSDISVRLKDLSRELGVPVMLLSQLKRGRGEPELDDLRDCGRIEEDADTVLMLHRPNPLKSGHTKVSFKKQRNGPGGALVLELTRETLTFRDMTNMSPDEVDPKVPRGKKKTPSPPHPTLKEDPDQGQEE